MIERYVIHTTKLCNMDCTYCYEEDKTSQYTWEEIENILKGIVENSVERKCTIEFLGGEPMIAFDHIQKTVAYLKAQENFEVLQFIITTNGTFANDNIIQWLKENEDVFVSVSVDGGRVANMLRIFKTTEKETLTTVEKNIKLFLSELGDRRVWSHMVTHPWNAYLIAKSINYIYNMGIRILSVGVIESTGTITKEYADRFVQEFHKVSNLMKRGELEGLYIDVFQEKPEVKPGKVYIKDKVTGKVLAETYGKASHDITHVDIENVESVRTTSDAADTIRELKEQVFINHEKNLRGEDQ